MILIELEKPAAEPVTIAEAKEWARIERGDEDALIGRLIAAARDGVERATGLVLAPREFRLALDRAPADGQVSLGRGPVNAVTDVTLYDRDGEARAGEPGAVAIVGETLVLAPEIAAAAAIEINFTAGLTAEAVPEALRVAILRIFAASYETRGLVGEAMQPAMVPPLAQALIAPFRRVQL